MTPPGEKPRLLRQATTVQGAVIEKTDVAIGTRGYVHVIASMLTPATQTVVDYVTDDTAFTKLVAAIERADLQGALGGTCCTAWAGR